MSALGPLRTLLEKHALAAYVQPVHDAYLNEYAPPCNRRVAWLSGFSGSAGSVAVTTDKAALFTDGRYTLQAAGEVDSAVFELHNSGVMPAEEWLAGILKPGDRVGYDPRLFTRGMMARMEAVLVPRGMMLAAQENLVDAIWAQRPAPPASPLFVHEVRYAGQESAEKRAGVAASVRAAGADIALVTAPDAVCWLLNIRARDIEHAPLLLAVALLDAHGRAELFVPPARAGDAVAAHLGGEVTVTDPSGLEARLRTLGGQRVLCDPQLVPLWFTQVLQAAGATIIEGQDPCLLPKACKNAVELEGIRTAHIRDGVAVAKLLCWLDAETARRQVSELEVCAQLLQLRSLHPMFVEPSFSTIAGSGPNGAVVHYRATEMSNRVLQPGELFLLDSGGQYPDGTTDITRTVVIGASSPAMRDRFTRVLKGHIALAMANFPEGTSGSQLDMLARQFLWQAHLDYDHGTGHGVGCFLNVHEGPQRIGKRGGDAVLRPGMVISNEPGYYKSGDYGIRIENLVTVVETQKDAHGGRWLGFDTLTCVPIDTRLVDVALMERGEKEWLNAYHAWVLESLGMAMNGAERAWLERACAAI